MPMRRGLGDEGECDASFRGRARRPLWIELKQLGGHRTQYSLWLINVNNAAKDRSRRVRNSQDGSERSRCSSLSEAGFLTSTVARGRQKSRPTDGPTPPARRKRFLGVDGCEQLLHGARCRCAERLV